MCVDSEGHLERTTGQGSLLPPIPKHLGPYFMFLGPLLSPCLCQLCVRLIVCQQRTSVLMQKACDGICANVSVQVL